MAGIRDLKGNPVADTANIPPPRMVRGGTPAVPESDGPVDLAAIKKGREAVEARRAADSPSDSELRLKFEPRGYIEVPADVEVVHRRDLTPSIPISASLLEHIERIENEIVFFEERARTLRALVDSLRQVAEADADKLERFEQLARLMGGTR